jgi:isoamylase
MSYRARRIVVLGLGLVLSAACGDSTHAPGSAEVGPTGGGDAAGGSSASHGDASGSGGSGLGSGEGGGADQGGAGVGGAGGADTEGPSKLGAHFDDDGALHIAVRSRVAERIEAWLYREAFGAPQRLIVSLVEDEAQTFRAVVPAAELAEHGFDDVAYYGYRAWGPGWQWDPAWTAGSEVGFTSDVDEAGNRFNPNKLLLDPYALEISHDPLHADHLDGAAYASGPEHRGTDTGAVAPKGVVVRAGMGAPVAPVGGALEDQIVYEVHVRGFTRADASLPESLRGTYAGAATKAAYLADLGVTAIELLPLHETQNEQNDIDPSSTSGDNYWGYSTLGFFAPERRYASDKSPGGPSRELKAMVEAFHDAGIAVIVDVVFNHTGEGGAWDAAGQVAPFYSWRGLDNAGYYQLGQTPSHYQNDNGVGPNLAARSSLARDLVLDSLRYWHDELGVDGFRFDLTPILANGCESGCFQFDPGDPEGILARAAAELPGAWLIAEPWGTGPGTYQIGNFPQGWAEWNGPYRDTLRDDQNRVDTASVTPGLLADRLSGSWSLFGDDGRPPSSSLNFVVAHDGLTLRDLYACNDKNNGQPWPFGPSDGGTDDNRAWDQGGSPDAQRHAARTGLALLMVSAGVPMITGGDEMYRTQRCNNNPYNLDSAGNWLDWTDLTRHGEFAHFARELMRFRRAHPALRPSDYRSFDDVDGNGLSTVAFYRDDGAVADAAYLDDVAHHFIGFRADGEEAGDSARSIFVGYNGWGSGLTVALPPPAPGHGWYLAGDTHPWLEEEGNFFAPGTEPRVDTPDYLLGGRSVLVLVEQPSGS